MTELKLVKKRVSLAIRLPNWVGDVCMTLPTLSALHALDVFDLRIHGKPWATDLLGGMPFSAKPLSKSFRETVNIYSTEGCRHGIAFPNSFSSALQMWLAGIAVTGYARECRQKFLTQALPPRPDLHEVESFWQLAQALVKRVAPGEGIGKAPPASLGLTMNQRHRVNAAAALKNAGVGADYIVLCPLAKGKIDGKSKIWPAFPLLCRALKDQGRTLVACPGPGEEGAVKQALPGAIIIPELGLGAYAAVMSGAVAVIANDSGPMHLAAAVDARVIGVFGVSDPRRTRPWSENGRVIGNGKGWPMISAAMEMIR
jgi:heptosyltransferase-2